MLSTFAYLAQAFQRREIAIVDLMMVEGILLALLAAIIYGFLGVSFEVAGKRRYPIWDFILAKQFIGFCIGISCTAFMRIPLLDLRLLRLGCIGAAAYVLCLGFYLIASRERNIAANWTVVNLSVVVPILVSVLWFRDMFSIGKGVGILFTVLSIVLIGGSSPQSETRQGLTSRWFVPIGIAFLLNGVLVILFRFVPLNESALFTAYFYGISVLLVIPYKLAVDRNWKFDRGLLIVSATGAASHWSGIMLTIAALSLVERVSKQAGVIVYPITNGLVIPMGVVLGSILLRQHANRRTVCGVAVGIVALVCLFVW